MVVKLIHFRIRLDIKFESRVILDGSQTKKIFMFIIIRFESRVILDGSQTSPQSIDHRQTV